MCCGPAAGELGDWRCLSRRVWWRWRPLAQQPAGSADAARLLAPSPVAAHLQGCDIERRGSQMKGLFLFSFRVSSCPRSLVAGLAVGDLADLGIKNLLLYLQSPGTLGRGQVAQARYGRAVLNVVNLDGHTTEDAEYEQKLKESIALFFLAT
ncbi:hypothetical protein U9M48_011950 [Paspalum notatum var. saurae]|uniref:Uncharacterized protein n=1 Tax=Paspalum notatum var. saurae TaxID=547442 RepID=A0AAQ3WI20_PASNO